MALWPGPAGGAPVTRGLAPAEADSLVWYVEDLEAEIKLLRIRAAAEADSLRLRLEFMGYRLQWAEADRPRWWQRPGVAFLGGVAAAIALIAQVLRISF
jgi:hypothetical protein